MKSIKIVFLSVIFLISCNSSTTNIKFDTGKIESNFYSNDYLGIKLKIDPPWIILNKEQLERQMNERKEAIPEANRRSTVESGVTDLLLSLTIDTIQKMPQILFSSLNLKRDLKIKTETDFLNSLVRQVKQAYNSYVQITNSDILEEEIGGKKYHTVLITIKADNFLAYQKEYCIIINSRMLNIMTNYNSEIYSKYCRDLLSNLEWN